MPRSEKRQTNFTFIIKVRIESDSAAPRGSEMHKWRLGRIFDRHEAVKFEESAGIRCSIRSCDHNFTAEDVRDTLE